MLLNHVDTVGNFFNSGAEPVGDLRAVRLSRAAADVSFVTLRPQKPAVARCAFNAARPVILFPQCVVFAISGKRDRWA
jgi:hypothetical protein